MRRLLLASLTTGYWLAISAAEAQVETVPALRYRCFAAESFDDMNHGGGGWLDELWFESRGVVANVSRDSRIEDGTFVSEPKLNAFYSEIRNWSAEGVRRDDLEQPTERVEVPIALAERIFALAELNRRIEEERRALGPLLVAERLVSGRGIDSEAPPLPAATLSATATAFLAGWAEPLGDDVDPVARFPKRVRRLKDGGEMVLVPRGPFEMGIEDVPRRSVRLTASYYLDVNEVTVAQWKRFARDTGAELPSGDVGDAAPIGGVTHAEAAAYAAWVSCALPTEAQWERAARAAQTYAKFPTDEYHDRVEQRNGAGDADSFAGPAPVRSFPPNPWGLFDLAGNVAEWCSDGYAPFEESNEEVRDPAGPAGAAAATRVVKGGSWKSTGTALSIGRRDEVAAGERREDLGFRCARVLP